jgi:cell division protein ZapA
MPSYNMTVLGVPVSFKAEADQKRVEDAKRLVEERYKRLSPEGKQISKEKLLLFVAMGLADDLLQSNQRLRGQEESLARLLAKIDEA